MRVSLVARLALMAAATLALVAPVAAEGVGPVHARRTGSIKDAPAATYVTPSLPAYSWAGLYVGAHVGYGWSDIDWQDPVVSSSDGRGWLAGGQVGYNWQRGALVFGVEADATGAWIDGSDSGVGHDVNWLASVRGRLGLAINNNRTLLYGTGGVAWGDFDYSAAGFDGFSDRHFGWVAGGGIEHMLSPNITARVEYLYYGFDDVTASAGSLGAGAVAVEPSVQTVRFGLNYKF